MIDVVANVIGVVLGFTAAAAAASIYRRIRTAPEAAMVSFHLLPRKSRQQFDRLLLAHTMIAAGFLVRTVAVVSEHGLLLSAADLWSIVWAVPVVYTLVSWRGAMGP